jgi:hypothetical protein
VVRFTTAGGGHWFADIDDADDQQPDDPFWYLDRCGSQTQALRTACLELVALTARMRRGDHLTRVLESLLVHS